jgi:hypothetical protein
VQALDQAVQQEDQLKFTVAVQEETLRRVSPDNTNGLPSFLPLHRGMRLLLSSKDCVRFGLVKGCICILREIVFAPEEELLLDAVAGQPQKLNFMPVSLLLQAEDAQWTLPRTELPAKLPPGLIRRGLFQLRPSRDYLSVASGSEYISVRRTTFRATPADTITVYAAQGSTFDAVVADMERPPNLPLDKHWFACYVMLSRARSFEGFPVPRPATRMVRTDTTSSRRTPSPPRIRCSLAAAS